MFDKMAIFINKKSGDRFTIYREDLPEYLRDYDLDESEAEVLSLDQATADEIASLAAAELENANYHSFVSVPEQFLEKLRARGVDEKTQLEALWALIDSLGEFFY